MYNNNVQLHTTSQGDPQFVLFFSLSLSLSRGYDAQLNSPLGGMRFSSLYKNRCYVQLRANKIRVNGWSFQL
jgi:hypothetical protein